MQEGAPHGLWVRVDSPALAALQRWIQRRFGGAALGLEPLAGDCLLARWPLDGPGDLYRATVEEVAGAGADLGVRVRYMDFGNTGDGLTMAELAPWSAFLDPIPPQAALCRLVGAPLAASHLTLRQYLAFTSAMRAAGSLQVSVHGVMDGRLEVALRTREGEDMFQTVRRLPELDGCFMAGGVVEVEEREQLSPPPDDVVVRARWKVANWLGAGEQGVEVQEQVALEDQEQVSVVEENTYIEKHSELENQEADISGKERKEVDDIQVLEPEEKGVEGDGEAVVVDQRQFSVVGESVEGVVVEVSRCGEVWLAPMDHHTQHQLLMVTTSLEGEVEGSGTGDMEVVGSCWGVTSNGRELRVRVTEVTEELLVVMSIDLGFTLAVAREELRPLARGPAREVPGLAVCGQLAGPGTGATPGAWCTALVTRGGNLLVVVEEGVEEEVWDPMAVHYSEVTNHYRAGEELALAVEGYSSSRPLCPFYTNRGRCYKGEHCEELHPAARAGAVTADREEELVLPHLPLPARPVQRAAELTSAISLVTFYLTFPGGLEERWRVASFKHRLARWAASLQEFYSSQPRRLLLPSLPAPGTALVARTADGRWRRAVLLTTSYAADYMEDVFLVDAGREERVEGHHLRALDPSFVRMPRQALLCHLAGVEPAAGVWGADATLRLTHIIAGRRLTARLLLPTVEGSVPVEVTVVGREGEEDLATMLVKEGLAKRTRHRAERGCMVAG